MNSLLNYLALVVVGLLLSISSDGWAVQVNSLAPIVSADSIQSKQPAEHVPPIVQAPMNKFDGGLPPIIQKMGGELEKPKSSALLAPLAPLVKGSKRQSKPQNQTADPSKVIQASAQWPNDQWSTFPQANPSSPLPFRMATNVPQVNLPPQELAFPNGQSVSQPQVQFATPHSVSPAPKMMTPISSTSNSSVPLPINQPQDLPPVTSINSIDDLSLAPIFERSNTVIVPPADSPVYQSNIQSLPLVANADCVTCDTGSGAFPGNVYGISGAVTSASHYFYADALYMTRRSQNINSSNFGGVGSFNDDLGWRFTLGQRFDATSGTELIYFGTTTLESNSNITDAAGRARARFTPADGFTNSAISSFINANRQVQRLENDLHSAEYNWNTWRWDVFKASSGIRGIYSAEDFVFLSQNLAAEQGHYSSDISNFLVGPQIGGELFYDIGYRISYSIAGKAGVGANFAERDTILFNAGTSQIARNTSSTNFGGWIDFGLLAHYQMAPQARLRGGFQMLYLWDIATTQGNFPNVITPTTGAISHDDEATYYGLFLGLEFYR